MSTKVTSRKLGEVLPGVLAKVEARFHLQPQNVVDAWPEVIGSKLAAMSRAERFEDGVLYVKVKNSTLLSLLSNPHDKSKLIQSIRVKFSGISIRNIVFRIG